MRIVHRPEVELLWCGTVDEGKQLELSATINGVGHALATIVADDKDESLWFEVYVNGECVQIPLSVIEKILTLAHGEVHSETWYVENVYPKT